MTQQSLLVQQKTANFVSLTNPAAPSTSEIMLRYLSLFSLWLGPIFTFYTAFLHQSSYVFSLTWAVVGYFSALLLSLPVHCLQFELESIWPGKSRHCTCVREGGCQQCTKVIYTQTLPLALIGCIELGAVDSCKSNYSHWVEPQTVDFYTDNLYLILLSHHYDNFSKYDKKIVTDYSINWSPQCLHWMTCLTQLYILFMIASFHHMENFEMSCASFYTHFSKLRNLH